MKKLATVIAVLAVASIAVAQGVKTGATDQSGNLLITEGNVDGNASVDTAIGNNTAVAANTAKVSADGSVTTHNDVTSAGSGAIITADERTKVGAAVTNNQQSVTLQGTFSGDLDISGENVTDLSDVSSAGSGAIITSAERTKLTAAITNNQQSVTLQGTFSGDIDLSAESVTDLSDVSSAGSGAIITAAERTVVGKAVTNDGPITAQLTAEAGADSGKYLQNDGDGTVSWQSVSAGTASKSGIEVCDAATNAVSFTTPFTAGSSVVVQVSLNDQPDYQVSAFAYNVTTNGFDLSIDNGTTAYDATGLSVGWAAVVANNP